MFARSFVFVDKDTTTVNHFSRLSALLSAATIIVVPGIACAIPLESVYPVASENSNPTCYMEQTSGSTLDLTRLCTSTGSPIRSSNVSNSSRRNYSSNYSSSSLSGNEPDTNGKSTLPPLNTESSYSSPNRSAGESASTQIERERREANEKIYSDTRFGASNYDGAANCSTPDDIAVDGYPCGNRAASVRLGGR
jgi:hypothetical protein